MSEKVKVTNLVKTFGANKVLKGINLTVQNNEVVVIIGPSGSGKSTLLRTLNKLEEPTSGSVVIDNVDIANKNAN
ncbi:MAG: ATP-binding cassette domain-containing protein, partial [Lentilactobacillus hilgardii]